MSSLLKLIGSASKNTLLKHVYISYQFLISLNRGQQSRSRPDVLQSGDLAASSRDPIRVSTQGQRLSQCQVDHRQNGVTAHGKPHCGRLWN